MAVRTFLFVWLTVDIAGRYAFNLFPELRTKEAVGPVPASAVRPAALGDDELFGAGANWWSAYMCTRANVCCVAADVAKKVVIASAARPVASGAAEIFSASPKSASIPSSSSFGGFFPATAVPVTAEEPTPPSVAVVDVVPPTQQAAASKKDEDDTLFATFHMELGSHKDKLLVRYHVCVCVCVCVCL